jgi:hypothetical protein
MADRAHGRGQLIATGSYDGSVRVWEEQECGK